MEEVGPVTAPITVIFSHGWTLRSGSWHYQRLALAGPGLRRVPEPTERRDRRTQQAPRSTEPPTARLVFYDQRSHGKSTRAPDGHSTMDYLAADLRSMIATAAPVGPVVLIGHSMGGMAILTLAAAHPDLFAERIAGIGLVCTGATYLKPSELQPAADDRRKPAGPGAHGRRLRGTRRSSSGAGPATGTRCGC